MSERSSPSSSCMKDSSFCPPGCRRNAEISSRLNPWRARKPSAKILDSFADQFAAHPWKARCGIRNPADRNPIAASELGNRKHSDAKMRGPGASRPVTTTPAAPSPNSTAEIKLACEKLLALKRKRGQLDRHQQRRAIRKRGEIFPGAREARSARRAAEFGDGQPAHIWAKSHDRRDVGVKRRNHHACAGYGDEQIHVGGRHAGLRQRSLGHLQAKFDGLFLIFGVDLRKRAGLNRVFRRKHAVTLIDRRIVDHFANRFQPCAFQSENTSADAVLHDLAG